MRIIHKCFIVGMILPLSLQAKGFDCVKNAQEVGKTILYLEMFKDFIKDVTKDIVGIKGEIIEVKKQKEVLDKIEKQNEEIIKLLKHQR